MNMLKMCLNWKVIAGLALVGVALFAYAPGLAAAALPFLVLAICPISMIFMMKAMNGGVGGDSKPNQGRAMSGEEQPEGHQGQLDLLKAQQQELAATIAELEAVEGGSAKAGSASVGGAVRTEALR